MMYCRFCGKQIEEDSVFCKYCGKQNGTDTSSTNKTNIAQRFRKMSQWKKIVTLLYILYVLCFLWWYCVVGYRDRDAFQEMLLCTIIIPACLVVIWYLYKVIRDVICTKNAVRALRSQQQKTSANLYTAETFDIEKQITPAIEHHNKSSKLLFFEPLLEFAKHTGRMQVVNNEEDKECYCRFVSPEGDMIRVDFADKVGSLSAQDISKQKYQLAVYAYSDGSYVLDYADAKQLLAYYDAH